MSYYNMQETESRLAKVREILRDKKLDAALVYFDELQEQRRAAVAAYETQFGPLTMYGNVDSGCDNWKWANGPWPWQNY